MEAPPAGMVKNWLGEDVEAPKARTLFSEMGQGEEPGGGAPPAPRVLAQLHDSYILAQGPKGLYVIDQHAAHERLIFNRLMAELKERGVSSQGMLIGEALELDPHESLAVSILKAPLERLGYRLEPFGGRTWLLKAVPSLLKPGPAKEALREILSSARNRLKNFEGAGLEDLLEEHAGTWLYSLACRAAIKAGDKLSKLEMESLLKDVSRAGAGGHCPHGRPSVWHVTLSEIEKRFGRT